MASHSKKAINKSSSTFNELTILLLLIFLLLLGAILILGYTITKYNRSTTNTSFDLNHTHQAYEVPMDELAPAINYLDIKKDAKSGWNLIINTENFEFSPELVNQEHVSGKGHAHLYIDGKKITRIYSRNYYISGYDDGIHDLVVTLNTNSHSDYYVEGVIVSASARLTGSHDHNAETPTEHLH